MVTGPEKFWSDLLSEDERQIARAMASLQPEERPSVIAHLQRMAEGKGWVEGQRRRARTALRWLAKQPPSPGKAIGDKPTSRSDPS